MNILKFGGTSVGSPSRIREVADILLEYKDPVFAVLSAMSGTTNTLVEIANCFYRKRDQHAIKLIEELRDKYYDHIEELYSSEATKEATRLFIQQRMDFICSFRDEIFTSYEEKQILAQGEIMSTNMMVNYLKEQGHDAILLNALDFIYTDKYAEPDLPLIKQKLDETMQNNRGHRIYITQGFICTNAFGETDNLLRGGSDYTASLIGALMPADEIQIWTDIDGIHNNDPRIVEHTHPIRNISFEEAAELAYFGAKILHPTCVQPAKNAGVPIRLKYTMEPKAEGTLIKGACQKGHVMAVAAKDNIVALQIRSKRNLTANNFLKKIIETCDNYQATIDLMTTTEVGVAICFEENKNLKDIVDQLRHYGVVSVEENQCIVCVVGDFSPSNVGLASKTTDALRTLPVKMVNYGGSNFSISFLIEKTEKQSVLQKLNEQLFA